MSETRKARRRVALAGAVAWAAFVLAGPVRVNDAGLLPIVDPGASWRVASQAIEAGVASWYGFQFHGHLTASGAVYDMFEFTAAHPWLPFGSMVEVFCPSTGKSVVVKVSDRGPYATGRIIDLSFKAAQLLGIEKAGIAFVEVYGVGILGLDLSSIHGIVEPQ